MIHEPEWPVWGLDRATGEAPVMRFCEALKREGLIGAIGAGGWDCACIADLIETGRIDVVLTVMHYDLAMQDARDRLLPVAQQHEVGIIVGAPFRQGALSVRQEDAVARMVQTGEYLHGFNADVIRRIGSLYALSDETGMDLIEMGIRYVLSDPRISSIIPGPRTVGQLEANLAMAAKGPLPAELVARIDAIGRL
jgi:aryl-alcohol dehydrogenase-like predicted oxidoreductase